MKLALAVLLTLISCTANAEIYKWTDKEGVVHFGDKQPEKQEKIAPSKVETVELSPIQIMAGGRVISTDTEDSGLLAIWTRKAENLKMDIQLYIDKLLKKTPDITNETIATNNNAVGQNTEKNKVASVEIYTASWCGACKKAKHWFNERGVAYKEYDVEKDASAVLRMRKLGGGNGVPFTVINGERFQGFDPSGYTAALN